MDDIKRVINKTLDLMEKDNRGAQIGCYSVALISFAIAVRRVRPFTRFRKPSDIPNRFIEERRELTGLVERIDPNGGLLMIKHKPLVSLPSMSSGALPVKISGIKVSSLGLSWLQTIVAGSEVKFIPVAKGDKFVQCEVLLPQTIRDKKKKKEYITNVNVGESLVKIGFGQVVNVDPPISSDPIFLSYYKRLKLAENYALRKQLGLKYYVKPTKIVLISGIGHLSQWLKTLSKTIVSVPKLVAS